MATQTFNYTGVDQIFTVPAGVSSVSAKLWAAGGGGSVGVFGGSSGAGGFTTGTIPVAPGQILKIVVGQGGLNQSTTVTYGGGGGGGINNIDIYIGGSGGGRSAIQLDGKEILTAGGGGGNAGGSTAGAIGGSGGGLSGLTAYIATPCLVLGSGGGGTQTAGGAAGQGFDPGTDGVQYQGGNGGITRGGNAGGGGGGGGGYYGGGGGAGQGYQGVGCVGDTTSQDCAGGGGSAYIDPIILNGLTMSVPIKTLTPPNTTDPDYQTGIGVGYDKKGPGGNGLVVIYYVPNPFVLTKSVDKGYSDINSNIKYTLNFANTVGTTISNVTIVDTIPNGTTFVNNSLNLNGIPIVGNLNAPGLNIGTMPPDATYTLTFNVYAPTIPKENPLLNQGMINYLNNTAPITSNIVVTTIVTASASIRKSAPLTPLQLGKTVTYTVIVTTFGNVQLNKVTVIDTVPVGGTLIPNSLYVNGVNIPNASLAPPTGYTLGNVSPNTVTTINYTVVVTTIPQSNALINTANLNYSYTFTPTDIDGITKTTASNTVTIPIINIDLSGIKKYVDKRYADVGDTILYTIVIPNNSNIAITNILFHDTIPQGTVFVQNSVTVNGVGVNGSPQTGIPLGNMPAYSVTTVQFKIYIPGQ